MSAITRDAKEHKSARVATPERGSRCRYRLLVGKVISVHLPKLQTCAQIIHDESEAIVAVEISKQTGGSKTGLEVQPHVKFLQAILIRSRQKHPMKALRLGFKSCFISCWCYKVPIHEWVKAPYTYTNGTGFVWT